MAPKERLKTQMEWEGFSGTSMDWRFSVWEVHSIIWCDKKSAFGKQEWGRPQGLRFCRVGTDTLADARLLHSSLNKQIAPLMTLPDTF